MPKNTLLVRQPNRCQPLSAAAEQRPFPTCSFSVCLILQFCLVTCISNSSLSPLLSLLFSRLFSHLIFIHTNNSLTVKETAQGEILHHQNCINLTRYIIFSFHTLKTHIPTYSHTYTHTYLRYGTVIHTLNKREPCIFISTQVFHNISFNLFLSTNFILLI